MKDKEEKRNSYPWIQTGRRTQKIKKIKELIAGQVCESTDYEFLYACTREAPNLGPGHS